MNIEKKRRCEVQSDPHRVPERTQDRISQFASKKFDKSISGALVSKILKEGKIRISLSKEKGERPRTRPVQYIHLEESFFLWFHWVSG